jgi:hypothetical protein
MPVFSYVIEPLQFARPTAVHGLMAHHEVNALRTNSLMFEKLHGALMLLGFLMRLERAQVPALAGLWINLSRIEAILART